MSVFKATKNRKEVGSDSFKATERRSYDSTMVYDWQKANEESTALLNTYTTKIQKGEYLYAEDLETYRTAIDSYIDSSTNLRDLSKALGTSSKEEDDATWQQTFTDLQSNFKLASDYYSKYDSEDAFKKAVEDQKAYEAQYAEWMSLDLNAGKEEINNLQQIVDEMEELQRSIDVTYNGIQAGARGYANEQERATLQARLAELTSKYGDRSELKSALSEKKVNYTLAERAQKAAELASVADVESENYDPEFEKYAELGNHISYENVGGTTKIGNGLTVYDDLKAATLVLNERWLGQELYTEDMVKPKSGIAGYIEGLKGLSDYNTENAEKINVFRQMTDKELSTFAYYLKKDEEGNTNLAEQYIDSIVESLNYREAEDIAESYDGKPVLQYLFAVEAGVDQFQSGIKGWFADGYTPTSVTQYASGMIREDLSDTGAKLPDWLGGSSLGQVDYDIINTTSNMLPSILASTVSNMALPGSGAIVGATLMGASAGGSAKVEMLNLGYSKEQATTYGVMVAVAEGSMEYLLGHIPGVSKGDGVFSTLGAKAATKVDNAISRVAIKLGNKGTSILKAVANGAIKITGGALDEGLEEGLQTVLEGWFKEIATGVDFEDPSADEVLYSSLLGALTAAGFGGGKLAIDTGVNTINTAINTSKVGNSFIKQNGQSGVGALAAQGLELNQNTAAYKQAAKVQAKLDSGKSASRYSVGKLYSSMSESQTSTAVQSRLSAHIENKTEVRKLSDTITDILYGRDVSDKALSAVAANKYALNALNDVLGSKLGKNAAVSEVRAAVQSYQEAGKSDRGGMASTKAKQGSTGKISGQSGATFSISENADSKFDVVAEADGERRALMSFKSQKQAQAAAYAMTLGMGAEGLHGLVTMSESIASGVDLGEAALAFNAFYNQGKSGKALSAAKNMELLSPEQRQYAYNLGIMDKALNSARKKNAVTDLSGENDGKVLQKDGESGKININKENANYEQGVHIRESSKRNDGKDTEGQVSAVEGGTGETEKQGSRSSQEARTARIGALVESEGLEKVSSRSLGIGNGTDTENVVVIPESEYDDGMHQIAEDQEAQGRKVVFVSGALEFVEDGKVDVARGLIAEDGKTMWIQADGVVSPEQIALHEEYHAIVKADPSRINRMKKKINKKYKGKLNVLIKMYAALYFTDENGKVTVSSKYILEEIFADAYAGIDVFEVIPDAAARATDIQEDIRGGTKALQSTRAPPGNSGVKASRLPQRGRSQEIETMENNRFERLRKYRDNLPSEWFAFTKDYYYIYSNQSFTDYTILLKVKITNRNKMAIDNFTKEIENGIDGSTTAFDSWFAHFRRGKGRYSWNSISSAGVGTTKRTNGMDGRNIQGDFRGQAWEYDISGPQKSSGNSEKITLVNETEEVLSALKSKYGVDDSEVKASRSLRSPEDVAQAYLDAVPNRLILANAIESQVTDPDAKEKLRKYKDNLSTIESKQAKLDKTKRELKDLYFSKGKRNVEKIKTLEQRRDRLQKIIDNADSWLLKYEEMKPIRELIDREKEAAYKKAVAEGKRKLAEYRERVKAHEDEIRKGYREARDKGVESRRSGDIRKKIKAFKDKHQQTLQHPTERKYIPGALAQAMIDVCELINIDTELYKADGSVNKAQQRRVQTREKLARLREEYKKIKNDADPLYAGEFDEVIANYLEKLESKFKDKPLSEMSLAELEEMYSILHSIDGTLKDARKLIGQKEAVDVYDAGDTIIAEQRDIENKRRNGKRGAVKKLNDGIANQSLSPVRRVLEVCGYNRNSPLYKLFKDFEVGVRKAQFFVMGAKKTFGALTTGKNSEAYENAVYQADGGKIYIDAKDRKFGISKMMKMQAILSYERELASKKTRHVENGGIVFADLDRLSKGNLKGSIDAENSHKVLGPEAVKLIAQFKSELEGDRWAQDYMNAARIFFNETAKTAINDTYMQLKHRILAIEDAYIPFEVDRNSIVREISAEYDIQKTISSYGMLQETQKGSSNALIMTGLNNVLDRHIEQVGTIHGLAVAIRNFNKVWNVKSAEGATVKEQIQATAGDGAIKVIEQTVQDLQGERITKHEAFSRIYKKVKSNYIRATFFMNISVRLKQIGSMFSATSVIEYRGPARMLANLVYTKFNHKKIAAEVDKYTATAWMRQQGLSDAELQSLSTAKKRTWIGKLLTEGGSKGMIQTDYLVALSLWKYAKQDVAKKTGLRGEELLKATAEYYDEVVETTQSMTDVLHRPEIQRSGGIGTELLGTFKTDLYQNAGNLRIAVGEFMQNGTKENARKLGKVVGAIMTSAMWGSIVTSLMAILRYKPDRYRDDEDDELTAESWLKVQGMDMLEEFAGYIFPHFGSETVDIIQVIASGSNAYSENFVSSISFDAINDVFTAISKLTSDFKDEDDLTFEDFEDLIISCGNVFGVPTSNLIRTGRSIYMHAQDIANGDFLSFNEGYYSSTKISKTDKLYRAMINDDKDRIDEIKAQFKNESDATSAIKKAIREKDSRVQEAVEGVLSGDYGTYNDIKDEVKAEKHFDAKTVNNAFADEREYVLGKLSDARKALRQGDTEEYKKIIDSLLDRGYSEGFIKRKLK